eukprot:scaffold123392_cov42-Phaeocystis_antarctica.AAC.1
MVASACNCSSSSRHSARVAAASATLPVGMGSDLLKNRRYLYSAHAVLPLGTGIWVHSIYSRTLPRPLETTAKVPPYAIKLTQSSAAPPARV